MKKPIIGICPRCGRRSAFTWVGANLYRCKKCQGLPEREKIKTIPELPQKELFT